MGATFDANHYVPVLKIKKGEKEALLLVGDLHCPKITPLLEVVARGPDKTVKEHLDTTFKQLADSAGRFPRVFLDTREIAADGPKAAQEVYARARGSGIAFAPVTGVSRSVDVAAALSEREHGIVVRLTRDEFERGQLRKEIGRFLAQHQLQPEEIDLVVDLGPMDQLVAPGVRALSTQFLTSVPDHARWRTFTLSGSAFPGTMGVVPKLSSTTVSRLEWSNWLELYERGEATRLPTFSDSGIQHPKGVEDFDFRKMTVSASVRYTLYDEWLLLKGESTKVKPPGEQFPKLAAQLTKGKCKTMFRGPGHCAGCSQIVAAAAGRPRLGSATVWRRIGTAHHITTVMEALDAHILP